ncbi:DUF302 domain-containing protein [Thiohalomonas denitrificans]|uniref:DUF302 domain-containing protein n=1 Tax=Thiohalomonas denitrificans TaxID=415747 RepID=UPI0026F1A7EF|nr:DUF302 domain-containing protein [Thiohalomonas denitrificans]
MNRYTAPLLLLLGLFSAGVANAQPLLMVRAQQSFPETMLALQGVISDHGYRVSRVQRVDVGLTASGYATDKYRIVFYGKPEQVRSLTAKYSQLIPYLPQKITIFAEEEETLVTTVDPAFFRKLVADPEAHVIFKQWRSDVESMLDELSEAE